MSSHQNGRKPVGFGMIATLVAIVAVLCLLVFLLGLQLGFEFEQLVFLVVTVAAAVGGLFLLQTVVNKFN